MTSDPALVKSETPIGQSLIHVPHSLLMLLSIGHDWFPITLILTGKYISNFNADK